MAEKIYSRELGKLEDKNLLFSACPFMTVS